ncbi:MAG: hypothetical protein RSA22_04010 [Acinetobacter sp.]
MPIPLIKTPGQYFEVNTNTQRSGLPQNKHKILFVTDDNQPASTAMPVNLDSKAKADATFGENSVAGRMVAAAIATNRFMDVQGLGKSLAEI